MSTVPVWLITACSSGFGKEITLSALRRGHKVIATGRNISKLSAVASAGAHVLTLDVTVPLDDIRAIVTEANNVYGRIDVLVNAAGYTILGAVEECTPEETYDQFNTNVFGTLNVIRAVLPYMRAQHSGIIANFGSLTSWGGGARFGLYCSSKWAVSGLTESLRPELEGFGITAALIEPGYFRSGILNVGATVIARAMKEYEGSPSAMAREAARSVDNNQPGDVRKGAEVIVDTLMKSDVVGGKEIPLRLVLGTDAYGAIKGKCETTLDLLEEWKDVIFSTDYPKDE
jgi:NAD(P)-dependent dehydrogenase (short-subunit alcohol dehydrogenase family)